ncbi:hypothetical protein PPO43_05950 [Saprospira sp. CCB-QB6]|uniref:hypothetical protein n=1 Tax=Saprospira sp. CCB-QB6 TaxID=3023936 RepID=UPI00234A0985|nr:hypothetical protein [Saprospira sp. CCB-QB6]WCL82640.1 hypothetical protein PPO43_05950 [Saprospira sp. CCB-QB6]
MKIKTTLTLLCAAMMGMQLQAQNVGIGEPAPSGKLDILQTETTGNSIEVNHTVNSNGSSAVFLRNAGTNRALHVQNLLTTNGSSIARFLQLGQGNGVEIDMDAASPSGVASFLVNNAGAGYGGYFIQPAGNTRPGLLVDHSGTGYGLMVYQNTTGNGMYNDVTNGIGFVNIIRGNQTGFLGDHTTAGGTGVSISLDVQDGVGYIVDADNGNSSTPATAGGDVYGFFANMYTASPTSGGTIAGAAFAANQGGLSHGILINHTGAQGRNAEFNINGATNTDETVFATNLGQGPVFVGQQQSNSITGVVTAGDFSYTGSDVADHIGVAGSSTPTAGWGIGVEGTGNFYGVYANGNIGATGTKTFIIDHPEDPQNKMLKHFSIESDEVLNLYRGIAQLDANGEATIELPSYFSALNRNFSYQLTAIGTPQQPYVLEEIANNTFVVAGKPGTKVSWTVYAERNDAYLQAHPEERQTEIVKDGERAGKYLQPELYGQPKTEYMFYRKSSEKQQPSKIQLPKQKELETQQQDRPTIKIQKETTELPTLD